MIQPQLEETMKTFQRSQRNSIIGIKTHIVEEIIDYK